MSNMIGHAAARAQLSSDASSLSLVEFWAQRSGIEIVEPRRTAVPYLWKWTDIQARLAVVSRMVP